MWGTSKVSQRKNSQFSVKHGKLKSAYMDRKEDQDTVRKFSSKAKVSKVKSTKSNKKHLRLHRKIGIFDQGY